jgi:hypothetical protein
LDRPVARVFPLFSPEGEKLWVPGWDYENILGSTQLHEDYVFLTKSHDHAAGDAVWLVKAYEPESHRVQFYKVEPGHKVGIITVHCFELGMSSTRVEVTYEYISLGPGGDEFLENFTAFRYREFIGEWKTLLGRYFDSQGAYTA